MGTAQTPFDLQPRSGESEQSTPVVKQPTTKLTDAEVRDTQLTTRTSAAPTTEPIAATTVTATPDDSDNVPVGVDTETIVASDPEAPEEEDVPETSEADGVKAPTELAPDVMEEEPIPSDIESEALVITPSTPEEYSPPVTSIDVARSSGDNPFHLSDRASESAIAIARRSGALSSTRSTRPPRNNHKISSPTIAESSPVRSTPPVTDATADAAESAADEPVADEITSTDGVVSDADPSASAIAGEESHVDGNSEILDKIEKVVESDGRITEVFTGAEIGPISLDDAGAAGSDYKTLLFWILLVLSLIASILIYLERQTILGIFRAMNNSNFMDMLYRKRNANSNLIYSMLYVLFFINGGIFIYLIVNQAMQWTAYKYLLLSVVIIAGIYIIKHLVVLAVGAVYPIERVMKSYSFSIILTNSAVGLLLLPLNYVMAFADENLAMWAMWIGIGVFALFYLMRNLRTTFMALPLASRSYLHFLLYLCTVELMPLGVLWKVLS